MLVTRPIRMADLDQLLELVNQSGHGLTTLPKDRELLRKRIRVSELGFEHLADKPGGESYLFVMEDLARGRIVGTCGIGSKVGGFEPFYAYQIETTVHESKMLGVRKEVQVLHLVREHSGPSEIGSLFLAPEYRKSGNGRMLSLSRFLFMAEHRRFFDQTVIAEMRGVIDDQGRSPVWEALGKHFFDIDYTKADYLSIVDKKFIADLMPTHPIYIPLLPQSAQNVIGQVHEQTRPAMKILQEQGFEFCGMVDIFEAGPIVSCSLDQIKAVRQSQTALIQDITDHEPADPTPKLIATTTMPFLACRGTVHRYDNQSIRIDRVTALTLNVKVGEKLRYVCLYPERADLENPLL